MTPKEKRLQEREQNFQERVKKKEQQSSDNLTGSELVKMLEEDIPDTTNPEKMMELRCREAAELCEDFTDDIMSKLRNRDKFAWNFIEESRIRAQQEAISDKWLTRLKIFHGKYASKQRG